MGRAQAAFTVLALVVVCSLIAATLGAVVIDELNSPDTDDTVTAPEAGEDVFETELREDIEENPEDVESLAALGNYLAQTGRIEEGIASYEEALALAPTNVDIRLDFARDLAAGDKRADAELQFKRVIEARRDDPIPHFELGQLYAAWVPPRLGDAVASYQQVLIIGQDSFVTERAAEELRALGVATPAAAIPAASPASLEPTP